MILTINWGNMRNHDTGGGLRIVEGTVTIDDSLSMRMKRKVALYEALGCYNQLWSHEQLEDLSDFLLDMLDQIEPI